MIRKNITPYQMELKKEADAIRKRYIDKIENFYKYQHENTIPRELVDKAVQYINKAEDDGLRDVIRLTPSPTGVNIHIYGKGEVIIINSSKAKAYKLSELGGLK